jgi:hypothetical protein
VLQQGTASRTSQASISAALAVATANATAHLPSEHSGSTLAEMAQRDLDAALQLLADRAQYITGSTGAAIALRRDGKNDMLCRASTGSSAPELGALLSAEFGLSGESVRTRQVLRCDDIERDERVNREVCRQLGIASVAVMPVVNDDEVLGVFELFSGKVNAFGERDVTALKRLGEMVETAVKLSRAAEQVPENLQETSSSDAVSAQAENAATATSPEIEIPAIENRGIGAEVEFVADAAPAQESPRVESVAQPSREIPSAENLIGASKGARPHPDAEKPAAPEHSVNGPNRPLLWSLALDPAPNAAPADQGEVPATLRNLRKCEACGFPVSPGRALCVECEEKKWRGQLNKPRTSASSVRTSSSAAAAAAPAPAPKLPVGGTRDNSEPGQPPKKSSDSEIPLAHKSTTSPQLKASSQAPALQPELILSAAMQPSESWVSANKFVILTLLGIGAGAAVVFLLR